jgi:hypothetical protein
MQTTRRYPRTLKEAFGPHHHLAPIVEQYDPMPKADKSVVFMCCAIGIIVLLMALVGWL